MNLYTWKQFSFIINRWFEIYLISLSASREVFNLLWSSSFCLSACCEFIYLFFNDIAEIFGFLCIWIIYISLWSIDLQMESLAYRKMYFEEFCAAAISTHQLEALEGWEQIASTAFEYFEEEGNRVISIEELARVCSFISKLLKSHFFWLMYYYYSSCICLLFISICFNSLLQELNVGPSAYSFLKDWIRNSDGKLSLHGYTKFLHGVTLRSSNTRHH